MLPASLAPLRLATCRPVLLASLWSGTPWLFHFLLQFASLRFGNYTLNGLVGFELSHKTYGIIGTGNIGIEVGRPACVWRLVGVVGVAGGSEALSC